MPRALKPFTVVAFTIENSGVPAPINVNKVVVNGPVDESLFKAQQ